MSKFAVIQSNVVVNVIEAESLEVAIAVTGKVCTKLTTEKIGDILDPITGEPTGSKLPRYNLKTSLQIEQEAAAAAEAEAAAAEPTGEEPNA